VGGRLIAAAAFVLLPAAAAGQAGELKILSTRPGVTQAYLLLRPADRPVASVILFAGGAGQLNLTAAGIGGLKGNFLVRTRQLFAEQGFLVAVPDAPSDRGPGGLARFRSSREHSEDIKAIVADLRAIADVPVWVVGTSMGSVSAANAGARLAEGGPDGVVLTSSVTRPSRDMGESVDDVRLKDIRIPTLVVHHRGDKCAVSRYQDAVFLMKELRAAPRRELLSFDGGAPPQSEPCEARSAHGYLGLERQVVEAIAGWIKATTK
jgi:alpha-beta hydrolase superfamily lysophospholipase